MGCLCICTKRGTAREAAAQYRLVAQAMKRKIPMVAGMELEALDRCQDTRICIYDMYPLPDRTS